MQTAQNESYRRVTIGHRTEIECKACGDRWQRDPAYEVSCPTCKAAPGQICIWSGPRGALAHIGRDLAAMKLGRLHPCSALTWDGRHSRHVVLIAASTARAEAPSW